MSSIITITLNPAIDKSTTIPVLAAEKKMRCSQPVFEPGGGGVNVARALIRLGSRTVAMYLGGGRTGVFFASLLEAEGVPSLMSPIGSHTRENLIVKEQQTGRQYRFVMPGPVIQEYEWQRCLERLRYLEDVSYIVASGSLPQGVPPGIFASFSAIAREKGARFIVDTSGPALKAAVEEGAYLIKPNIAELCALTGKATLSSGEVAAEARKILANRKVEVIVVSMGASGAMLVTRDITRMISAPQVEVQSTVGAGDSMTAGIVHSLWKGKDILEAAYFGVACGTAATLSPGTGLCKKEDALRLYEEISKHSYEYTLSNNRRSIISYQQR